MLELRKVAVTGNLHSGKTTVCQLLQKYGAFVLNSDLIVHELIQKPQISQSIIELFGNSCVNDSGQIDRKKLSELVFQNEDFLRRLELLIHPLVFDAIVSRYEEESAKSDRETLFVVEVPLLYEVGWQNWFDLVILVVASEAIRKERFLAEGKKEFDFYQKSQKQIDPMIARQKATYTIINDQNLNHLESQVISILKELTY